LEAVRIRVYTIFVVEELLDNIITRKADVVEGLKPVEVAASYHDEPSLRMRHA
jgi:hypothetical protein